MGTSDDPVALLRVRIADLDAQLALQHQDAPCPWWLLFAWEALTELADQAMVALDPWEVIRLEGATLVSRLTASSVRESLARLSLGLAEEPSVDTTGWTGYAPMAQGDDIRLPEAGFRGDHLRSVLLVADRDAEADLKVQSLELYDDGVVLRWMRPERWWMRMPDSLVGDDNEFPNFSLSDDQGTDYEAQGGGASGGLTLRGESVFMPGVPDETRVLMVTAQGWSVEIDRTEGR